MAWQRFLSAYYLANVSLLGLYIVIRSRFLRNGPQEGYSRLSSADGLLSKERQAFPLLFAALAIKYWRQQSLDGFFSEAFFYCKACLALMLFYMDARLLFGLLLVWLVLFLVLPQPLYKGPTKVQSLTPASFKEAVTDAPDSGVSWLVELFAPWAPPCVHLEPVLAELSLAYTADHLRFGKVDVSRWPSVASQFRVDVSGVAQQLPTLILFERGAEAARIPHMYPDGSVAKGRFRKKDIITGFDLEGRYMKKPTPAEASGSRPGSSRRRR